MKKAAKELESISSRWRPGRHGDRRGRRSPLSSASPSFGGFALSSVRNCCCGPATVVPVAPYMWSTGR